MGELSPETQTHCSRMLGLGPLSPETLTWCSRMLGLGPLSPETLPETLTCSRMLGVGRAFTGDPDSELLDAGVGTALLTALAGLLVFAADGAGAPALAITGCPFTGGGACCRGAGCGCFAPAALAGGHGGGGMLPLCLAGGGWGTPAFTAKALPRDKMLARASGSVAAMTHLAALPFTMTWQGFRVF